MATLRDVLYRYNDARGVYERFVRECQCDPHVARNAVALLLWFDDQGTNQVISQLKSMSASALGHLLAEANCVIHCLCMRNVPDPPIPLLCAVCQNSHSHMDLPGFFALNQGHIVRGVAGLLDGVCKLVFDDRLYLLLRRHQTGLVGRNQELEAPYAGVGVVTVPEDYRSMFATFSIGQAVERDEIFNYFREIWGDCIVRVLMEKTTGGAQPMYGRVIFKSKAFVSLLLNGVDRASIFIGGCEIWLREYVPRNQAGSSNQGRSNN